MSATEVLRRLLDELEVEWRDSSDENVLHTTWNGMNCWFNEFPDGWTAWGMAMRGTPEQAVAATLGRGNVGKYVGLRRGKNWEHTEYSDYYCGGCGWKVTDHDSYCPECGGALHETTLGHSSNCTNSERTTTVDETERISISWQDGRHVTIRVMECGACGGTYEYVNGSYEYCPRCGAKVVDA